MRCVKLTVHQLATTRNQSLQLVCTCTSMCWLHVIFQKHLHVAEVILKFTNLRYMQQPGCVHVSKCSCERCTTALPIRWRWHFSYVFGKELSSVIAVQWCPELSQWTLFLCFLIHHKSHRLPGSRTILWQKEVLIPCASVKVTFTGLCKQEREGWNCIWRLLSNSNSCKPLGKAQKLPHMFISRYLACRVLRRAHFSF